MIKGRIVRGFGEGAFYVEKYAGLFEEALGWRPFAGTLNVKVKSLPQLNGGTAVSPGGKFKPVHCYHAVLKVNGKKVLGALIVPEATRHPKGIVELIAPIGIKEACGLKDGDEIICSLE